MLWTDLIGLYSLNILVFIFIVLGLINNTRHNNKFVLKWPTVVYVNLFVNYLGLCGLTSVLQAMPFQHKFANRYRQH